MSLPRVSSRTPLTTFVATTHDKEPGMSLTPHLAAIVAAVHPRKSKQRTTFIALLILMCLSTYIFIAHSAQLSPALSLRHSDHSAEQLAAALESMQQAHVSNKHKLKKSHHHFSSNKAQSVGLQMTREQELAAVTSFLASLPQNVIPENVDPSKPIDPQLVLDFDTRGPRAQEEVKAIMEEVWLRNPVFLYSKMYSSQSREVKTILNSLALRPAPTIIDVDTRDDAEILTPMLARLTAVPELPTLIIGGKPVGPVEEVKALHKSGQLQKMITEAGALINGAKRKKGRK